MQISLFHPVRPGFPLKEIMRFKATAAILLAAGISLYIPLPAFLRTASAVLIAFFLPGTVVLRFFARRDRPASDDLFLAAVLSPAVLAVLLFISRYVAGTLDGAITMSVSVLYTGLGALILLREDEPAQQRDRVPRSALFIAAAFAAVVAVMYTINGVLVMRSDAWFHACVTQEILHRGLPPMEPRFPDVPIRYMWIYHLFIAAFTRLSGRTVFQSLGIFNVAAALGLPYVLARLSSLYVKRPGKIVTAVLIGICGLQSASWILWPVVLVRTLTGEVAGSDEIARILAGIDLRSSDVIHFLAPYRTWMISMLDKYLTITAFGYSLNLFIAAFLVSEKITGERRARSLFLLFLIVFGAFLFHVITGTALILTMIGAAALSPFWRRFRDPKLDYRRFIPPAAVALLAGVAGLPYFLSLTAAGGVSGRSSLTIGLTSIITIALPLAILLPHVKKALAETFSGSPRFSILALWVICLASLAVLTDLPTVNESKLIFPLLMLLSAPVSWKIYDSVHSAAGWRKAVSISWFLLLFAVPAVLTLRGFALEDSRTRIEGRRYHITGSDRELFSWIEKNTGEEAVFMEDNEYTLIPALAGRRNFFPTEHSIKVDGYSGPLVDRYRKIRDLFYSDRRIERDSIEFLRNRGIDLYIVFRKGAAGSAPGVMSRLDSHPEWFEKVFENRDITVYRLIYTRERTGEGEGR